MTKRPKVMSLDDLMGTVPEPEPVEPTTPAIEPEAKAPKVAEPELPSPPAAATHEQPQAIEPPPANPKTPPAFRTSVYFHREVHDALREIAYRERKNISDLINEGLDHVLTSRDRPTTAQLRKGAKTQ